MWSKQRFSALLRRCRIISKTIIARQALKKSLYLKTLFLQHVLLTSRQLLGSWGHKKSKVIFGQINVFGLLCFIYIITIEGWFRHHRFSVVKPVQMMYNRVEWKTTFFENDSCSHWKSCLIQLNDRMQNFSPIREPLGVAHRARTNLYRPLSALQSPWGRPPASWPQ